MAKTHTKRSLPNWQQYENQVYQEFCAKYPEHELLYNQKLLGRYSQVQRQVDILVRATIADTEIIGVFDCKHFNKKIDVKVIDSMVGFVDDIGAQFGGIISVKGFSDGAKNRARAAGIHLRLISFVSPESVIDEFVPSLDFSDPRNSMYLAVI